MKHVAIVAIILLSSSCAGSNTPTSPTQQQAVVVVQTPTPTPTPAPSFPNMIGSWTGTETSTGAGLSLVCNLSWVITAQNGGNYSGSFQVSGANCSEGGTLSGTVTTTNGIGFTVTGIAGGSPNGCVDSNVVRNGIVSGSTLTIQASFIRTCTNPAVTIAETQTIALTKH